MTLKILQLNMWAGSRFDELKEFLQHNEFDILCFQEVSGPRNQGNVHVTKDAYRLLQGILNSNYNNVLVKSGTFKPAPEISYEGNAIFYKKDFSLIAKDVLWLFKRESPFPANINHFEELGRTALALKLSKNNKVFSVVTAHLAWGPTQEEKPHQRAQNLKLVEYIKKLDKPWVLTGDFNIDPNQPSVLDLEKLGRNLTKEFGVANTIDPLNHRKWENIKPGFAIDFIFVSPGIQVEDFKVLENVHMSDHFGLTATLSL